jgi:hypothetical protein
MPYGKKRHSKKRRARRVQSDDENCAQQEPTRTPVPDIRDNMTREELYDVCHRRLEYEWQTTHLSTTPFRLSGMSSAE